MFLQNIIGGRLLAEGGGSSIELAGIASEDYTQTALRRNDEILFG